MSQGEPVHKRIVLVGREHDHEAVTALLVRPDIRLVTITGVGGVGKTALARQVMDAVERDGQRVIFVELAPVSEASRVPSVIAGALDLVLHVDTDSLHSIGERLDEIPTLLVLDNLEHLNAAPVIARLLAATSHVRILVTSRKRLGLDGESAYPLAPLPVPVPALDQDAEAAIESLHDYASVRLLVERFVLSGQALTITPANASDVAELSRWLDGIPLAIELAARHGRLFSVRDILGQLVAQRDVLRAGTIAREDRLRAMEESVRWSLDLLDEETRQGFCQLCVFRGAFDTETALAVTRFDLETFARLVDHGLVDALPWTDQPVNRGFRILVPIREQGEHRARQTGVWLDMRDRHAAYFLALAERADFHRRGADPAEAHAVLERYPEDLLTAFGWTLDSGDAVTAARAAGAINAYWVQDVELHTGIALLDRIADALDLAPDCSPAIRGRLTVMRGIMRHNLGELDAAGVALDQAIAPARLHDADTMLAEALLQRISTYRALRQVDDAEQLVDEAQAAVDRTGLPVLATKFHFECAAIAHHRRDWDGVERHVFASMAARRQLGLHQRNFGLPGLLGLAHLGRGNVEAARACFCWVSDDVTIPETSRYATKEYLARLELQVNRPHEAASILVDCLRVQVRRGSTIWIAAVLIDCAWLATLVGEDGRALDLLAAAGAGDERAIDLLVKDEVTAMMEGLAVRTGAATFHTALQLGYPGDRRVLIDNTLTWLASLSASSRVPNSASPASPAQDGARLSCREREVLELIAGGASNKRIAERLFISATTVDTHVKAIYRKLSVNSRAAAVVEGLRLGLIAVEGMRNEG